MENIFGAGAAFSLFMAADLSRKPLRDGRIGDRFHQEGFPDPGCCLVRLFRLHAGSIPERITQRQRKKSREGIRVNYRKGKKLIFLVIKSFMFPSDKCKPQGSGPQIPEIKLMRGKKRGPSLFFL